MLELIQGRTKTDCMLCAWAMALGTTYEWMLDKVGAHGLEEHPEQPGVIRGWHSQEFVKVAWNAGYFPTHFQKVPVLRYPNGFESAVVSLVSTFEEALRHELGVMLLQPVAGRGPAHAVAFDRGLIYDPARPRPYGYIELKQTHWRPTDLFVVTL